jgi:hypothetical protein
MWTGFIWLRTEYVPRENPAQLASALYNYIRHYAHNSLYNETQNDTLRSVVSRKLTSGLFLYVY